MTYDYDTLVVCAGTPVTCLGMIKGFRGREIHLVATSKEKTVLRQLSKYKIEDDRVQIHTSPFDFYDEMKEHPAPFNCNRYWDRKVWHFIENNTEKLRGNTLFWNVIFIIGEKKCLFVVKQPPIQPSCQLIHVVLIANVTKKKNY